MKKHKQYGFTIVELLVIIVVIGILAAITVVAYNGIQTKAANTQLLGAIDSYEKALRQYKAINGTYPSINDTGAYYTCLGGPFPAKAPFGLNECYLYNDTVMAMKNPALDTTLSSMISPLPSTPDNTLILETPEAVRGIIYAASSDGNTANLIYVIKDNQQCGRGAKYADTTLGVNFTNCTTALD